MSRISSKNNANRIIYDAATDRGISYKLEGAPGSTILGWVKYSTLSATAQDQNRIISVYNGINAGIILGVDAFSTSNKRLTSYGRVTTSSSTRTRTCTAKYMDNADQWYAVGGRFDYAGQTQAASVDGSITSTASAWAATAYDHVGTTQYDDYLGSMNSSSTLVMWDGALAKFGVYKAALVNDEIVSHARGISPLWIRPMSLITFVPLWGINSPEIDFFDVNGWALSGDVPVGSDNPPCCPDELWMFGNPPIVGAAAGPTAKAGADTPSINLTEVATIYSTLLATDSVAASVGEAVSILSYLARAEDIPFTLGEVANILAQLSRSDETGISLVEAAAIVNILARADAPTVTLGEAATILNTLARSDVLNISVGDSATILNSITNRADTVAVGAVSGIPQILVGVSRSDEVQAGITDSVKTIAIAQTAADAPAVGVSEGTPTIMAASRRADAPVVGITEQSALLSKVNLQTSNVIGLIEQASVASVLLRADAPTVGIADVARVTTVNAAVDAPVIAVVESSEILVRLNRTDELSASVQESVALLAQMSRTDNPTLHLTDVSSLLRAYQVSDEVRLTLVEQVTQALISLTVDAPTLSVEEVARIVVSITSSDLLELQVEESSLVDYLLDRADSLQVSLIESARVTNVHPAASKRRLLMSGKTSAKQTGWTGVKRT